MRTALSPAGPRHRAAAKRGLPLFWQVIAGLGRVVLAAAAGIVFLLSPVTPAGATPGAQLVALAGAAPPSPSSFGAKPEGPAPWSASMSLQVYFRAGRHRPARHFRYCGVHARVGFVPSFSLRLAVRRPFWAERPDCLRSR